jgi:hypothetical protein
MPNSLMIMAGIVAATLVMWGYGVSQAAPQPARWEVKVWDPFLRSVGTDPVQMPDGWEPCGYKTGGGVLLKRRVR